MTILTLTLNPALDRYVAIPRLEPSRKLHCDHVETSPGGGGINVARAVHRLGGAATAIVACGGSAGVWLRDLLRAEGVVVVPITTTAITREDLTVTELSSGQQYRFVLPGATLERHELERCVAEVLSRLDPRPIVVISGSLPEGVEPGQLAELVTEIRHHCGRAVVDTSGAALVAAADAGAYLLKPSVNELAELTERRLSNVGEIAAAASELLEAGPNEAVLVSLAAAGALLVHRGETPVMVKPPSVPVISALGAGDSLVAGVVLSLERGAQLVEAVRYGVACGTAAVTAAGHTLCSGHDVEALLPDVVVSPAALADQTRLSSPR